MSAASGIAASRGTIVGTLKSVWLRKYPMIVYLEGVPGVYTPPGGSPTIDQKNKMFVPHVLPLLKGTTVRYVNHDDTKHNVYFIQPDGKKINLGTGMSDWSKDHEMDQVGVYVHRCNVHDEMAAYVVVMESPYFALIDKGSKTQSTFRLEGVPPGKYKLRVWCEKFYRNSSHKFNRAWQVSVTQGRETAVELKP